MPFVQAKCTICGGILAVDSEKKAAVCQFCGDAFIVEEAINNFITYNVTNNVTNHNFGDGAVVNLYENRASVDALLERAFMFLCDFENSKAKEYCERALDLDPKCAKAWLCKLMLDLHINNESRFEELTVDFECNKNYKNVMAFGDQQLKDKMSAYREKIRQNIEKAFEDEKRQQQCDMEYRQEARKDYLKVRNLLVSGGNKPYVVRTDGTVFNLEREKISILEKKENEEIESWRDIISVYSYFGAVIGLKADGKLVATAAYSDHVETIEEIKGWTDIVSVAANSKRIFGLKKEGSVVFTGKENYDTTEVKGWKNITAIAAAADYVIGLQADGTVLSTGEICSETIKKLHKDRFENIADIACGGKAALVLKADGDVAYITGEEYHGGGAILWHNKIIAIAANDSCAIGLREEGSVVCTSMTNHYDSRDNFAFTREIQKLSDVIAIAAGYKFILALKEDGSVVCIRETTDRYKKATAEVSKYDELKLFESLEDIEEEKKQARAWRKAEDERIKLENEQKAAEEEVQRLLAEQQKNYRSQGLCQYCGGTFKGMFGKKCINCGKAKDY